MILALHLVTLASPTEQVVTINSDDVVSLTTPHRGFDPKVKCIINMIDGKHVAVGINCEEVKKKLEDK